MSLTTRIFIAMVAGLSLGLLANFLLPAPETLVDTESLLASATKFFFDGVFDVVGQVFIASLKLLVVPLVFVSLVCGVASLREQSRVGPMALKTIGLYLLTTALAISIALAVALAISPGEGIELQSETVYDAKAAPPLKQVLIDIFPSNPIAAMAQGELLQVIVFALLFGVALSGAGARGMRMLEFFQDLNEVIMQMVMILMKLAPYGVFCLLATIFYETGYGLIFDLASYFAAVVIALLLHGLGVYSTLLNLFCRLNPIVFLKSLRPVLMFGFSTK